MATAEIWPPIQRFYMTQSDFNNENNDNRNNNNSNSNNNNRFEYHTYIYEQRSIRERERERERRERKGEASSAEQSENFIRFNAHEYVENAQTYTYTFVHTFAHQPLIPTLYMFVTRRGGRKA